MFFDHVVTEPTAGTVRIRKLGFLETFFERMMENVRMISGVTDVNMMNQIALLAFESSHSQKERRRRE